MHFLFKFSMENYNSQKANDSIMKSDSPNVRIVYPADTIVVNSIYWEEQQPNHYIISTGTFYCCYISIQEHLFLFYLRYIRLVIKQKEFSLL